MSHLTREHPYSYAPSPWAVRSHGVQQGRSPISTLTRSAALTALGPVVYAVRLPDGVIKIGHSGDMAMRLRVIRYRDGEPNLLAVQPGSEADEQEIHTALASHRARGREYYKPTREVLATVNTMRSLTGLEPLG